MGNVCSHTYELGLEARVRVNSVVGLGKVERNLFDFGKILLKKINRDFLLYARDKGRSLCLYCDPRPEGSN